MNAPNNLKQAVPFFFITNIEASLDFYQNSLGFTLKMEWRPFDKIEWCWLEREGVALMLQEYRKESLPIDKLGIGVSICIMCNDALTLYNEFIQKGLSLSEPFVGNGLWVVEVKDPDGYKIFFESPTEVPEETTYPDWLKSS